MHFLCYLRCTKCNQTLFIYWRYISKWLFYAEVHENNFRTRYRPYDRLWWNQEELLLKAIRLMIIDSEIYSSNQRPAWLRQGTCEESGLFVFELTIECACWYITSLIAQKDGGYYCSEPTGGDEAWRYAKPNITVRSRWLLCLAADKVYQEQTGGVDVSQSHPSHCVYENLVWLWDPTKVLIHQRITHLSESYILNA